MLHFLPRFLIGIIAIILYLINCIVMPTLCIGVGLLRLLIPIPWWQQKVDWFNHNFIVGNWIRGNRFIMWLTINTKFELHGQGKLSKHGQYLLICNHQSWTDIFISMKVFGNKIPTIMFFMKKQLIWNAPLLGTAAWLAGFPFMERHSAAYIKKHPEKRGQDIETTKRMCQRFNNQPTTIANFIEGTRFTPVKKRRQRSPYKYLLKPKLTSFAFMLSAMEKSLHEIINVTIIYPEGKKNLWNFVCGKIKKIIIIYDVIPITPELRGDYYDREYRAKLQQRLNQMWQEKDQLITKYTKTTGTKL